MDGKYSVGTCFDRSELAIGTSDGIIRFIHTASSEIYTEYVSTSHLSSVPTCFTCPLTICADVTKKRKKSVESSEHQLIACATSNGEILVFHKGELVYRVKKNRKYKVVSLIWLNTRLWCTWSNGTIGEIFDGQVVSEWRASTKDPVTASGIDPSGAYLFLGEKSGKLSLWLMNEKSLHFRFVGHSSAVAQIVILSSLLAITRAENDLHIGLWRLGNDNLVKSGDGSIPVLSPAVSLDVTENYLVVLTKSDGVVIFEIGGDYSKPLSSIRIETPSGKGIALCSFLSTSNEVIVGYGKCSRPRIEIFDIIPNDHRICTIDESALDNPELESDFMKVKLPVLSNVRHVLFNKRDENKSISIGEKISKSNVSQFSSLLAQGLKSGDKEILTEVLNCKDPQLIRSTLMNLDITLIPKFIDILTMRIQGHARLGLLAVAWMKPLLATHSSIISSHPELLRPLVHVAKYRTRTFFALCSLQGKVELLLSEMNKSDNSSTLVTNSLVIQDKDSSEDEEEVVENEGSSDDEFEEMNDDVNADELIDDLEHIDADMEID